MIFRVNILENIKKILRRESDMSLNENQKNKELQGHLRLNEIQK
jgi:hypothetical protein